MALGRYTGPTARLIAERLTDGRPKYSGGWYRVRGVCHKGDPRPDGGSLSIRDGKDRLIVHCFKDCDRRTVIEALESTTGWTIWNAWESGERRVGGGRSGGLSGAVPEVKQLSGSVVPSRDGTGSERHPGGDSFRREILHRSGCSCESCRITRARRLWTASAAIKTDTAHPARRWMAARNLYCPRIPVPAGVRWVEESHLGPRHEGTGAVAVLFAPPRDWIDSWPGPPPPTAVELIHVDSEGRAVLDRPAQDGGRSKRTHGVRRGSVAMFGNPVPSESPGLNLAEGSADALALAARLPETAVTVGGVGGMGTGSLREWLTGWMRVNLYADNDATGLSVAGRLRRLMVAQKVAVRVFTLGSGYKDAADFAADNPFDPEVDLDAARELAADLADEGMPTWEAHVGGRETRRADRRRVLIEGEGERRMNIEDKRVELPPGPLDLVAQAAERFRASPGDLSAWLELKVAVDEARPSRTDPLAKAVSIILDQLEDGADPYALAAAYGELDTRLNAVRPLDANSLSNPYPPEFEWLVYSWLPWGRVALLAGDGGLGKSRLALRLAAGIASAEPDWLGGISTAEGSKRLNLRLDQPEQVVIASWEDDLDEFDRRLAALGKHDATAGRVKFVDMADRGPLWAPLGNGHVASIASLTPAGEKLREYTEYTGAVLLVIDPLAAAYAGDENARGLVRAFLSSWDAWARRCGCAVLFVGHTPKNTSRTSGSTDWRNAVRSVWTLEYQVPQKPADLGQSQEPGVLVLECEKTNYGAPPQSIYLSRSGGVITETAKPEWVDGPPVVSTNGKGIYDDVV